MKLAKVSSRPAAQARGLAIPLGMVLFLIGPAAPAPAAGVAEFHARADAALQSFLLHFWSQGDQYLRANSPDNAHLTGYWTFAQGFDAVLDGVERTGGQAYAGLIETFYQARSSAAGRAIITTMRTGWPCFLRAHDLTGDRKYPSPRRPVRRYRERLGHLLLRDEAGASGGQGAVKPPPRTPVR